MKWRFGKHKRKFYPYVIQLGKNQEVLYVNFAVDVARAWSEFLRRRTHLRDSQLREDLCPKNITYSSSKQAVRGCRKQIEELEEAGFEVIAGGPLHNPYWQVYVIEIEGNPKHVYVGETNYPPEKRFQQHVYKFNPARVLLKYDNFDLAMEHADHLPVWKTKKDSLAAEKALAEELRLRGFKVEGGH